MNKQYKKKLVSMINKQSSKYKLIETSYGYYTIDPLPDNKELNFFYQNNYLNNDKKLSNMGMDVGSKDVIERFHHDREYDEIVKYLDEHFNNRNIKILDVGCGKGEFLKYLKKEGFDSLYGTELNSNIIAPGINIFNCGFLDFHTDEKFDFITMTNVLEHIIPVNQFIQKSYYLLNDNGRIRIQVPNDLSYTQYCALKEKEKPIFYFFCPPEHINYFDFESIKALLVTSNFDIDYQTTNWCMDFFLLMGIDYSLERSLGKKCHQYRINFEYMMGQDFLIKFYKKMAEMEVGRVAIIYAKK